MPNSPLIQNPNDLPLPPPPPPNFQHTTESPAQLAILLTSTLVENESLKRQVDAYKRKADRAERLNIDLTRLNNAKAQNTTGSPANSDDIQLLILECQERVERAEIKRDELEARIVRMQDAWIEYDRLQQSLDAKEHDARIKFSSLIASKGGELVVLGPGPPLQQALVQLRQDMAQQQQQQHVHGISFPHHHRSSRSETSPSIAPQHVPNPRVRHRPEDLDPNPYPPHLAASAQPPAKRLRAERSIPDRVLPGRPQDRHRSQSPPRIPHINGIVHHPTHPNVLPGVQDVLGRGRSSRGVDREIDDASLLHPSEARASHHRSSRHRRRSHTRSRSRASSASLDEMLLEATTEVPRAPSPSDDPEFAHNPQHRIPTQAIQLSSRQSSSHHLSPHHPSSARGVRHRSASPPREGEYHLTHHSRARGATVGAQHQPITSLHPSHSSSHPSHPSMSGPGVAGLNVPSGPGVPGINNDPALAGQVQYQTHTFAPPVTGPPVKKPKLANTPSLGSIAGGVGSQPSLPTIGAQPTVPSIPGGGYPSTNASGQRICRQCGQPGRYKDGKCVEKWGPGPEGPGTVCDRCRKKMKRVERRGTLDSQHLANSHNSIPHITTSSQSLGHSSSQNLIGNGRNNNNNNNGHSPLLPHASDRALHRSDTLIVDQPTRTAPNSAYLSTSSSRRDNSGSRSRGISPRGGPASNSGSSSRNVGRSPPMAMSTMVDGGPGYDELDVSSRYGGGVGGIDKVNGGGGQRSRRSTSSLSPPTPSASGTAVLGGSRKGSPRQSDSPRNGNGSGSGTHPATSSNLANHVHSASTHTTHSGLTLPSSSSQMKGHHNLNTSNTNNNTNANSHANSNSNSNKPSPSDLLDADGDVDADADAEAEMDMDADADGDVGDVEADVDAELLATVEGGSANLVGDGGSSHGSRSASRSRSGSGKDVSAVVGPGGVGVGGAGERDADADGDDEWLKKEDELSI